MITTQEEHQELAHLRAEVERLRAYSSKAIAALAECIGERDRMRDCLKDILDVADLLDCKGMNWSAKIEAALKGGQ